LADRLEAYIIANLTSKDLKLQVLVEHFGLSRSYISKLFKGAGSSFSERVAFHRTQKAKNLLLQTREPIYVVAELCGFKKQSWLSEAFLRVAGQSPSRFRQLHRPEEEDW
jgi:AraC-like DNA-binding protein